MLRILERIAHYASRPVWGRGSAAFQAEGWIVLGRLVLAAAFFAGVPQPASWLAAAYLVSSGVVLLRMVRLPGGHAVWMRWLTLPDAVILMAMLWAAGMPLPLALASYAYLTATAAAWWGPWETGAVAAIMGVLLALLALWVEPGAGPGLELEWLLLPIVALPSIGFAARSAATQRALLGFGGWGGPIAADWEDAVQATLVSAKTVLESHDTALLTCDEGDVAMTTSDGRTLIAETLLPGSDDAWGRSFVARSSDMLSPNREPGPVPPRLAGQLAAEWIVGAPLVCRGQPGFLLAAYRRPPRWRDEPFCRLAAGRVEHDLEVWDRADMERNLTLRDQSIRLARDLHDGVLQVLTAVGIRLQVLGGRVPAGPWADELAEVSRLLASEQQALRFFVRELRPEVLAQLQEGIPFGEVVADMVSDLQALWRIDVRVDIDADLILPDVLGYELHLVLQEALANAVRHGAARSARVTVRRDGAECALTVADDGRGFPFVGEYSAEQVRLQDIGPVSLKRRIAALQGTLAVASSAHGATLQIRVPCDAWVAA